MPYERDEVGFLVGHPCPHCGAALYLSPENEAKGQAPICLNGCFLPMWQYRRLQEGLRAAQDRVQAQDAERQEEGD